MARSIHLAAALVLVLSVPAAHAVEEAPLWEVGAGVAALDLPAYRGSDQRSTFLMPIPYFTYHGRILKADRHGLRGQVFDSDRLELTVSAALSPPAPSDSVIARAGMPDLQASFEVGPELDVTLWRSENRARFLKLQLPLRAAYTLERTPRDIGWVFNPKLNLDLTDVRGLPGWKFGFLAGPVFGDARQHDYFYGVAPQYATATRPAYAADAGYAGVQVLASTSKRFRKVWFGAFVRYDSLAGAVFADSPLVRRENDVAGGFAVSWIFGESSTRVPVDD